MGSYLGLISGTGIDAIDAALVDFAGLMNAIAFAWFAKRTLEGLTSSAGSVTGAKCARILGGVYRYN